MLHSPEGAHVHGACNAEESFWKMQSCILLRDFVISDICSDEIDSYYDRTLAEAVGVSTGWTALNPLYNAPERKNEREFVSAFKLAEGFVRDISGKGFALSKSLSLAKYLP